MADYVLWALAGGLVGWAGFARFKLNATRGRMFSIAMGVVAGVFGGAVLAPILGVTTLNPGDFHPMALFMSVVSPAACLTVGNMIHNRFGV